MGKGSFRWLYAYAAGVVIGVLSTLFWLGHPEWWAHVWTETAAGWAAAIGTGFAGFVALWLGVLSIRQNNERSKQRAAAAAIAVSTSLYNLRAVLDVIKENSAMVLADKSGYANWLSAFSKNIGEMKPVIRKRHLSWVQDLPTLDLFTLVMADNWFRRFKDQHLLREGILVSQVVQKFEPFIEELLAGQRLIEQASNRTHSLSCIPGQPPWAKPVPSWVRPDEP